MSLSELQYQGKQAKLEITLRVFIDDLESDLAREGNPPLYLGTPKENSRADALIREYMDRHFRIQIDRKWRKPLWVGKEISEDLTAFWIYLEIDPLRPFQAIYIENSILCDLYADQQNIVRILLDKEHEGYALLTPQKRNYELKWKP